MSSFDFDSNTQKFSKKNAFAMAQAAKLAYGEKAHIRKKVLNIWKFNKCQFFDSIDGTQAFAACNNKLVILSFRGTEPNKIKDWITDINFDLVNGPLNGMVHEGFYTALSNVWKSIEIVIESMSNSWTKPIWVTGHSLGAALATLAVALLIEKERPVKGLYTFGQPRTGNNDFARNFNFEFKPFAFRFVNNNDIVTRVPTREMDYSHIGTFKYFTSNQKLVSDINYWNRLLDRVQGRIKNILKWTPDGIGDHDMSNYVGLIKNIL